MAPEEEFLALRDIFFADLGGEYKAPVYIDLRNSISSRIEYPEICILSVIVFFS